MTISRRVKPARVTAAAPGTTLPLPRPRPRAPRRPERLPGKPRVHAGPAEVASTAPPLLHAEARAEDLEAGDDPHPEDRERDRDLDEREAPPHPAASPTWTVPRSGSSATLRRCSLRSRRPATITSAPLVLPFGKKRICTTPSPKARPPRTSSMTARSVSTAQRR